MDILCLPTYIINLKKRTERLTHVLNEFKDKEEFKITVIEAVEDSVGAAGLWKSMIKIINLAIENNEDVIVLCEDDHQFTKNYNKEFLFENIVDAYNQGADILCGGISGGFGHVLPLTKNRFWIDNYWCNQFIVIYKSFYQTMLETEFDRTKKVDNTLSELTSNKMVLYPFISEQKFFGYSDVTKYNQDHPEWTQNRFAMASEKLQVIQEVYRYYYE
ncbi:hypothetical protein ABIE26_002524 [Pedobacter africanus]|uniref:Glycosyl transferase family 25 n=1 Tax=Pedobacter africanus TaxID=151894 RepID=A0ACC6KY67_9SPHI|nr:hypothetical protein [Pedobacter africanus]MDR6784087.1 glycosyl transferase family 25 [Pedobacter africanus]